MSCQFYVRPETYGLSGSGKAILSRSQAFHFSTWSYNQPLLDLNHSLLIFQRISELIGFTNRVFFEIC